MAFASFGIITPVLSVVISVFMLGLGLGSWLGGRWIEPASRRARVSPLLFYALAELGIGLGAFAVPGLFKGGESWLLSAGQSDSAQYLLFSGLVLAGSLLPWCLLMGTTFPFMMAFVRREEGRSPESFSYLYLANVLGATAGAILTAVAFIELFGFRDTLRLAASANVLVAMVAIYLTTRQSASAPAGSQEHTTAGAVPGPESAALGPALPGVEPGKLRAGWIYLVLFTTGLVSMAMEVVWTRAFAPVLKTQVYSFALIVAAYLAATFAGSYWYRADYRRGHPRNSAVLIAWVCAAALLPVLANDVRWLRIVFWDPTPHLPSTLLLLASICPLCALLGYLTPSLIDHHASGSPQPAGLAYAANVAGCILGPLLASYLLLPFISEKHALILLSLPLFGLSFAGIRRLPRPTLLRTAPLNIGVFALALLWTTSFEDAVRHPANRAYVKRDHAASVVASAAGGEKSLLVNGFGMTKLTPITKCMTHMPLAFLKEPPQSALVICFGMGTSHRSALSWDIQTTAVELVPSVVEVFDYYHQDAPLVRQNPKGRIVIDDGRRFLARTREQFDVIVIDPPPPVESAGSSLLYSKEFYELAKRRLKPGGILQAWMPEDVMGVEAAALRSLCEVFPHVRCFRSLEGWGLHMLASSEAMAANLQDTLARMPAKAKQDLTEWDPNRTAEQYMAAAMSRELPVTAVLAANPGARITDDEPYNEYYLIRRWLRPKRPGP